MITRYDLKDGSKAYQSDDGLWVKHSDFQKLVRALENAVKCLEHNSIDQAETNYTPRTYRECKAVLEKQH